MTTLYGDPHTLVARLLRRTVRLESGCWIFQGATNSRGYGIVCSGRKGKSILTHRLVVIARDGSIPEGLTVDHQCHDSQVCRDDADCVHRRCVNPAHLAVMTMGENTARRWESGLCLKGHPLVAKKRGRYCPTCHAAYQREWQARRHGPRRAAPAPDRDARALLGLDRRRLPVSSHPGRRRARSPGRVERPPHSAPRPGPHATEEKQRPARSRCERRAGHQPREG